LRLGRADLLEDLQSPDVRDDSIAVTPEGGQVPTLVAQADRQIGQRIGITNGQRLTKRHSLDAFGQGLLLAVVARESNSKRVVQARPLAIVSRVGKLALQRREAVGVTAIHKVRISASLAKRHRRRRRAARSSS